MSRHALIIVAALALAAPAVAQPPPAAPLPGLRGQAQPAPGPNAAVQEFAQLNFIASAAEKCGWFDPLQVKTLDVSIRERFAAIGAQGDAALVVQSFLAGQDAGKRAQSFECESAAAAQAKAQSQASADRLTAIWLARANAVAAFDAPWAKEISTVGPQAGALKAGLAKAVAAPPAVASAAQADALRSLSLICDERKTVRSPNPRACPPGAPSDKPYIPYARAWVELVEEFAPVFAASRPADGSAAALDLRTLSEPAAARPSFLAAGEQVGSYFKWTAPSAGPLTLEQPACGKGDLVIKPSKDVLAGATVQASLTRLGEAATVGKVSVRAGRTGLQFLALEPDAAAKAAGVAAGGVFKQCGSATGA